MVKNSKLEFDPNISLYIHYTCILFVFNINPCSFILLYVFTSPDTPLHLMNRPPILRSQTAPPVSKHINSRSHFFA
jgi:hypothetical protein